MTNLVTDFKAQMALARRNQILQGAAQVFAEKGFHKATTKQIAKTAGVSEGTIYNYFKNKRELLFALLDMVGTQPLQSIVHEAPPNDPRAFLTTLMHNRYQLLKTHGPLLAPIMAEIFTDSTLRSEVYDMLIVPMAKLVEQYFQTQVDDKRFRSINVMIITRTLVGALSFNMIFKLSNIDPRYAQISEDEMIEEIVTLFLDGILAT
ncbi:TetR/AcrR family transcriptional regulator [Anaerolineales bacterium HSG25]|nr:TetR/AcrR family transcriptional regulator [Anaerolineales bacterium HSG25]